MVLAAQYAIWIEMTLGAHEDVLTHVFQLTSD